VPSIRAAVSIACSTTGNLGFADLEIDQLPLAPLPFPVSSFSTARRKSSFGTIEVLAVLDKDVKSGLRQAAFAAGPETA
jgi:hypothetical protein